MFNLFNFFFQTVKARCIYRCINHQIFWKYTTVSNSVIQLEILPNLEHKWLLGAALAKRFLNLTQRLQTMRLEQQKQRIMVQQLKALLVRVESMDFIPTMVCMSSWSVLSAQIWCTLQFIRSILNFIYFPVTYLSHLWLPPFFEGKF